MPEKILFSWSGGKDSALALHSLINNKNFDILALLTTVTADFGRISMHGVRQELLVQQAESIGLPLEKVVISKNSSNEEYEEKLKAALLRYKNEGAGSVAFGDIFLEDLKKHREENLAKIGMKGMFPLWKQSSYVLAKRFIDLKFKAIVTCVDGNQLDGKFCGRMFDESFLSDLPKNVDCCGENGEFHSFVFGGPIFKKNILFSAGEIVKRDDRFYFCDLGPEGQP
ncbi:MAG: diphthine--ammonia ligase [Chitinivibrionales bacterium]